MHLDWTAWSWHLLVDLVRLVALVAAGVFLGAAAEGVGVVRWGAFLTRPFVRLGGLPAVCGVSFVTSLVSPRAGNSLLAGAYAGRSISRRSMIIGALGNAFPSTLAHMRLTAFVLVSLLGWVGLAYVLFQAANGLLCTLSALVAGRVWGARERGGVPTTALPTEIRLGGRQFLTRAWARTRVVLPRVALITVPLYAAVEVLDRLGMFARLAAHLPGAVTHILPPAGLAIVVAHMTNLAGAAGIARGLLHTGELTSLQVLLTFVVGYGLTIPIRALRHSIPSAVGIFPGTDGLWIVAISQALRLAYAVAVAGVLVTCLM